MRVAVVGAGSWGTALARLAAARAEVHLWAREPEVVAAVRKTGENALFLPGHPLPAGVTCTSSLAEALAEAEVVLMAVPSHGFRAVLRAATPHLPDAAPVVSVTKGIEQGTLKRMTEIVLEETGADPGRVGVLTGPNLAREIADGQPAATVVALSDEERALAVQALFMGPTLRVYTNPDVIGCEAAGALKNVMAIAAGMAHGLGYGDNSAAALMTRALAELTRLGVAMGGRPLTFAGLAGMGDLVATCISRHSRNRQVGVALGRGRRIDEIVAEMQTVAEGVKTTEAVLALAARHDIEMPIAAMVGAVLYENRNPADMVAGLMGRPAKAELQGID
ncbi:MAG TPA: NAD(P)H-dependent glycerol-3-phosphate dehydrogenase [Acidimicrobiia bacterium]|nr:NAD(P)H-dependent glycerol-3-phosphate dehydrogenase [Acidimicrobiia bacterium]